MLDGRAPQSAHGQRPADLFAPGRADGADGERETGEAVYERFLVEAAKRADQLDASWTDFVTDCLSGRAPSTRSDRGWYALWERFDDTKVSPACTRFVADFKMAAREFERRMSEAADRRAGRRRLSRRLPPAPPAPPPRLPRLVALSVPCTFAQTPGNSDIAPPDSPAAADP